MFMPLTVIASMENHEVDKVYVGLGCETSIVVLHINAMSVISWTIPKLLDGIVLCGSQRCCSCQTDIFFVRYPCKVGSKGELNGERNRNFDKKV